VGTARDEAAHRDAAMSDCADAWRYYPAPHHRRTSPSRSVLTMRPDSWRAQAVGEDGVRRSRAGQAAGATSSC